MTRVAEFWGERDPRRLTEAVMSALVCYGYGALPADPVQARVKIGMFCKVLEDEPVWAVEQAAFHWVKTNTESAPTPADLLNRAKTEKGRYDQLCLKSNREYVGYVHAILCAWVNGGDWRNAQA